MQWSWTYWLENTGNITGTVTMGLDPTQSYMVEGYLTKAAGGDYGHVYIAEVCTQGSAEIQCTPTNEAGAGVVTVLSNATSVTVGLHTTGGNYRAEGVVWQL